MRVKTHAHLFLKGSMIHEKPVSIIDKHSFFYRIFFTLSVLLLPFLLKATPGLFDFLATGQGAQKGLPSVIIFYEPDCAHCKKMSNQLQEAAGFDKALQRRFYVELADITTVKGKELARKFNIHSVPAVVHSDIATGKYNTINGFPGVDKLAGLLQVDYKLPATLDQQHAVAGGAPQCGNGSIEVGEQCDDANTSNGDGCSATCQLEAVPKGVAINETGQLPDISSILDVSSTKKGLLIPRVANNEMQNIISPANGLLVYNTDSACFAYRNATAWVFLKGNGTASNDWSTKGNAGTNATTNFIGSTDNVNVVFRRNNLRAGLIGGANTSFGDQALNPASTGTTNTAIGYRALFVNTTGSRNTANGYTSLPENTTGSSNTAMGVGSLNTNSTGSGNTAIGNISLQSNSTANNNTAVGNAALNLNGIGYSNVAVGVAALQNNTSRSNLVAIGDSALFNNGTGAVNEVNATANTAVGSKALYSNTTGSSNTAVGFESLKNNTTGSANTAMGWLSMGLSTGGFSNAAFGYRALLSNSGLENVAMGLDALSSNETGGYNTAVGSGAMGGPSNGSNNTAVGYWAGLFNEGSSNVFLGYKAGINEVGSNKLYISNDETNAANTLVYGEFDNKIVSIGGKLGVGMIPETNNDFPLLVKGNGGSSDLIKFFDNARTPKWHLSMYGQSVDGNGLNFAETGVADFRLFLRAGGEVGIGKEPLITNDDSRLQIKQKDAQNGIGIESPTNNNHWDFYVTGGASSDFRLYYNGALKGTFDNISGAYTANSDRRLKKDITQQQPVLNNVMQLQAYQYHYLDNQPTDRFSNGFMAQEVQKIFPDAVVENTMKDGEKRLGINYQYFTVLAIKGLQEQQKIIETQTNNMQQQEERIAKLEAAVKALMPKN